MIWRTALHYARFGLFLSLASSQFSEEQKEEILELHNLYRSQVYPEAADMLHMTWDDGLALVAKNYAALCIWRHNPDVQDQLGENIYITTGTLTLNKSMARWFEEQKHYDYNSNTCLGDMCGHYIQVVWAKTNTVGCAAHFCKTVQSMDYTNVMMLVCNYYPPGNVEGHQPYKAGVPCSKCPKEATECIANNCAPFDGTFSPEDFGPDTSPTDTPWTKAAGSVGFTKPSVATLLLAGLTAALLL